MRALGMGVVVVASMVASSSPARACAPAPPPGAEVGIAAEEALIVWDAASRTQHFIRRADFQTSAADFGFLVPTPTEPSLHEVPDVLFERLAAATVPEPVEQDSYSVLTCCMVPYAFMLAGDAAGAPGGALVDVLSTQRVAGMDATVLRANDAAALGAWLSEHGYPMREALVRWLRPYVDAGFVVTAFRYVNDGGPRVGSAAVRMTFTTERPFYPYREPSDLPEWLGRSLRLYVVAASRMAATAGRTPWSAQVEHARPWPDARATLGDAVPPETLPEGAWLTSFLDRSAVRVSHDLAFAPSDDASEVARPARVITHEVAIPLPLEPLVILGGGIYWWRRRKQARSTAS